MTICAILSSFVEAHHPSVNRMVAGSNPARGAKNSNKLMAYSHGGASLRSAPPVPLDLSVRASAPIVMTATALARHSGCASADGAAGLTDGCSSYAHAVDPCPTRAADSGDFRDDAVRLRNIGRNRHGLRRHRDGQDERSNCNQPDLTWLPVSNQTNLRCSILQWGEACAS